MRVVSAHLATGPYGREGGSPLAICQRTSRASGRSSTSLPAATTSIPVALPITGQLATPTFSLEGLADRARGHGLRQCRAVEHARSHRRISRRHGASSWPLSGCTRGLTKRKVKFTPVGHSGTGATRYSGNHARRPPVVLVSLRATHTTSDHRHPPFL